MAELPCERTGDVQYREVHRSAVRLTGKPVMQDVAGINAVISGRTVVRGIVNALSSNLRWSRPCWPRCIRCGLPKRPTRLYAVGYADVQPGLTVLLCRRSGHQRPARASPVPANQSSNPASAVDAVGGLSQICDRDSVKLL